MVERFRVAELVTITAPTSQEKMRRVRLLAFEQSTRSVNWVSRDPDRRDENEVGRS
jgi:hypothetical protein